MNDDPGNYGLSDQVLMTQSMGDPQQAGMDPYMGYQNAAAQFPQELLTMLLRSQPPPKGSSRPNEFTARGSWTQHEDDQLIAAVQQLGPKKWTDIAKFVPSRTSKQCRERWHQRLDPGIRHEPFEPWEDQIIIEKQRELGNHWSLIAQHIKGRCANSIKNRWYSGLRSQHPTQAQMDAPSIHLGMVNTDLPPQLLDLPEHSIGPMGQSDL